MEDLSYCLAVRFADGERAEGEYGRVRLLLRRADCNLSVYRILLDGVPHIIALGEEPPGPLGELLRNALAVGEPVVLAPEVVDALAARRSQQRIRV